MQFDVETKLSVEVEKESQKKLRLLCKIAMIVGIIGLIANIMIGVIFFEDKEPFWMEVFLYVSSVLFAIGLVIPIFLQQMTKKSLPVIHGVVNVYHFEEESFTVISMRSEEKIAEVKHSYVEISKVRETENYLYLHLSMRGVYPIARSALTEEGRVWLLGLGKKKK